MVHPVDILLDVNTSDADKYLAVEEIICKYEINLNPEQIQLAMNKVLNYEHNQYNMYDKLESKIIVLKSVLNDNTSMFVALMLAILDGFEIKEFQNFLHADNYSFHVVFGGYSNAYTKLLDFYDFDVNKLKMYCNQKQYIINYRNNKYAGKMTKRAI